MPDVQYLRGHGERQVLLRMHPNNR